MRECSANKVCNAMCFSSEWLDAKQAVVSCWSDRAKTCPHVCCVSSAKELATQVVITHMLYHCMCGCPHSPPPQHTHMTSDVNTHMTLRATRPCVRPSWCSRLEGAGGCLEWVNSAAGGPSLPTPWTKVSMCVPGGDEHVSCWKTLNHQPCDDDE